MKRLFIVFLGLFIFFLNCPTLSYSEVKRMPTMDSELDYTDEDLESYPEYDLPDKSDGSLQDLPGDAQKRPFGGFDKMRGLKIKSDFK